MNIFTRIKQYFSTDRTDEDRVRILGIYFAQSQTLIETVTSGEWRWFIANATDDLFHAREQLVARYLYPDEAA